MTTQVYVKSLLSKIKDLEAQLEGAANVILNGESDCDCKNWMKVRLSNGGYVYGESSSINQLKKELSIHATALMLIRNIEDELILPGKELGVVERISAVLEEFRNS